jgi:hypothetical protein
MSERPALEVADIFRAHGAAYRRTHRVSVQEQKVMRAIERCRTAALGGHVDACGGCGHQEISYNSCRNRFCPKCQGQARAQWVEAREAELLPIEYFHVVFTLPHGLNALVRQNRALLLNALFAAVSDTLLEFGRRHLGGEIGVLAVLHTWGQRLCEHNHVHTIVTGGALSADGGQWKACRGGFLFPVRALQEVFRGKYSALLRRAHVRGELRLEGDLAELKEKEAFGEWMAGLYQERWIVYAKRPFAGPRTVVRYLGRYTHRGPIANSRLVNLEAGRVRFSWKDYREAGRWKQMELSGEEFIRRYMLHVLPHGFMRIRYYGLYTHTRRASRLSQARTLLEKEREVEGEAGTADRGAEAVSPEEGQPGDVCPRCAGGRMSRRMEWKAGERPRSLLDVQETWAA